MFKGDPQAHFKEGDRVLISSEFFWAKGAIGAIGRPPEHVVALSGPWGYDGIARIERSALGEAKVYWVYFDEPQNDADGYGPYKGGQIWASALTRLV